MIRGPRALGAASVFAASGDSDADSDAESESESDPAAADEVVGVVVEEASSNFLTEGTVWKRKPKRSSSGSGSGGGNSGGGIVGGGGGEPPAEEEVNQAESLRKGTNIFLGGAVSIAALTLGLGASAVVEGLEKLPLLQGFEEAVGVAVSAYYANRLKGNFLTTTGREQFRLKLIEGYSSVTGMAAAGPDTGPLSHLNVSLC